MNMQKFIFVSRQNICFSQFVFKFLARAPKTRRRLSSQFLMSEKNKQNSSCFFLLKLIQASF